MTLRNSFGSLLILAAICLSALSCGQEKTLEQKSAAELLEDVKSNNTLTEITGSVFYESVAGDFEIRLPSGCSSYRERIPSGSAGDDIEMVRMALFMYCDREGRTNEGCSVAAYVDTDLDSGTPASPEFVHARIQSVLQKYGAHVVNQRQYRRVLEDGPLMEGVDVLATDAQSQGQVWIRGLLVEGDVYLLTAWRMVGQLAEDPEIVEFFESFRAHI